MLTHPTYSVILILSQGATDAMSIDSVVAPPPVRRSRTAFLDKLKKGPAHDVDLVVSDSESEAAMVHTVTPQL